MINHKPRISMAKTPESTFPIKDASQSTSSKIIVKEQENDLVIQNKTMLSHGLFHLLRICLFSIVFIFTYLHLQSRYNRDDGFTFNSNFLHYKIRFNPFHRITNINESPITNHQTDDVPTKKSFNKVSMTQNKMQGTDLGKQLLQDGDPTGAEAVCLISTSKNELDVEGWICLGEARLAIHDKAWKSILVKTDTPIVYEPLTLARESFNKAILLNPTHPGARLGMGLCLFLLGTRTRGGSVSINQESSSNQLLFESILHFNAASSITSPNHQSSYETSSLSTPSHLENIHIAALHNMALAYIALGDSSSAIPYLQKVQTFVDKRYGNTTGISASATNLGAAIIHRGNTKEAMSFTNNQTNYQLCLSDYNDYDDFEFHGESIFESLDTQSRRHKLCSILLSNAGVIQESMEELTNRHHHDPEVLDDILYKYEVASQLELKIGFKDDGFSAINSDNFHRFHRESLQVIHELEYYPIQDKKETISNEKKIDHNVYQTFQESDYDSTDLGPITMDTALDELKKAVLRHPHRSQLWLYLSRAKLNSGDKVGALEAAARALSVSVGSDETDSSMDAIEASFDLLSNKDKKDESSMDIPLSSFSDTSNAVMKSNYDELKYLHLEKEVLSLKLQLLQRSMDEINGFHMPQHTKIDVQNNIHPQAKVSEYQQNEEIEVKEVSVEGIVTDVKLEIENSHEIKEEEALNVEAEEIILHDEEILESNVVETPEINFESEAEAYELNVDNNDTITTNIDSLPRIENEVEIETVVNESNIVLLEETDEQDTSTTIDSAIQVPESNVGKVEDDVEPKADTGNLADGSHINDTEIVLPTLYNPTVIQPQELAQTSMSYMKIADAYIEKGNFIQASKQFLKVIKKSPDHIPALLGYASTLERQNKPNFLEDVVMAYNNVTKYAILQGEAGLAEAAFRRSIERSKGIQVGRINYLHLLSEIIFTDTVASELYYEIGLEHLKAGNRDLAWNSFTTSNALVVRGSEDVNDFHPKSTFHIGKLLLSEGDAKLQQALDKFKIARTKELDEFNLECLILSGEVKEKLDDVSGAIEDYKEAILLPSGELSGKAFYQLGLALRKENINADVKSYIQKALNLGLDLTTEALEILGEDDIAVMRSKHRKEWKEYQDSLKPSGRQGGVINGSGSITNESIFASKQVESENDQSFEPLSLLEQGAASYDGSVPTGDETGETMTTNGTGRQQTSSRSKSYI